MASKQKTILFSALVALAFATSSLTALRLGGLPFGTSEILILLCLVLHFPLGQGIHLSNRSHFFSFLTLALLVAMLPGFFVTLSRDGVLPTTQYNLIAGIYVVLIVGYLHFGFDRKRAPLEQFASLFVAFSSVIFLLVLILIAIDPAVVYALSDTDQELNLDLAGRLVGDGEGGISRLVGFAENPNQLALHALSSAVLCVYLVRSDRYFLPLLGLVIAITVGAFTGSDAFYIGVAVLLVFSVALGILFSGSVILCLAVLIPAIVGAIALWSKVAGQFLRVAQEGDQDATRYTLWINGIDAGLMHPLIGWGPGTWSGFEGPLGLEEAHNSAIDYFSSSGLIGLAILIVGLGVIYFRTFTSKQAALFAGVLAISAYAMFHNILRQPVTWMTLYLLTQTAVGGIRSTRTRRKQRKRRSSRASGF